MGTGGSGSNGSAGTSVTGVERLPGFQKKSLLLYYRGGEIWFEHLDGLYEHEALVLEKLKNDRKTFCRASYPSMIGFVLDETEVTRNISEAIADALLHSGKLFRMVCFIGTDKKTRKALQAVLSDGTFMLEFINDLEKAKEWFIPE